MPNFSLGIELDGAGSAPPAVRRTVQAAENAGFTFVTFADSIVSAPGRVDAVSRAAFVAATTSTIGLVPVVETTYAEPFHLAAQLATLDYASRGRAGWIAARVTDPAAGRAWGRSEPDADTEQRDAIEVIRRLWDSWEDDAVIRDVESGRFLDRDRLHYVDFDGTSFSVKGPAIVPRPPQGQLVVFGAGADHDQVDVVLAAAPGAAPGAALVFVEIEVSLDPRTRSADATGSGSGRLQYRGAPAGFTELLTDLAEHSDGVRLVSPALDRDLPLLAAQVLPKLFASGVAHRPVPGSTLRASLGLSRPLNRYAKV